MQPQPSQLSIAQISSPEVARLSKKHGIVNSGRQDLLIAEFVGDVGENGRVEAMRQAHFKQLSSQNENFKVFQNLLFFQKEISFFFFNEHLH